MIVNALIDDPETTEPEVLASLSSIFSKFQLGQGVYRYAVGTGDETRIDGYIELLKLCTKLGELSERRKILRNIEKHWVRGGKKICQYQKWRRKVCYPSIRFGAIGLANALVPGTE